MLIIESIFAHCSAKLNLKKVTVMLVYFLDHNSNVHIKTELE